MSAIESLLPLRAEERELLSVRVISAEERFAVIHTIRGQIGEDDHVRFALYYYARVLFEVVRTSRSARDLPSLIDIIAAARLHRDSDLFGVA